MLNRIINFMKQDFDKQCDLHDDCNDCPYNSDYDAPCHCKDIKEFDWNNYLLKKVSVTNNWISVKDRLPEMYETVLVFCKDALSDFQCVSEMIEPNGKKWSAVCSFPVTHWQPLPEPPKGE